MTSPEIFSSFYRRGQLYFDVISFGHRRAYKTSNIKKYDETLLNISIFNSVHVPAYTVKYEAVPPNIIDSLKLLRACEIFKHALKE